MSSHCCGPRRCVFARCLWAVRHGRGVPALPPTRRLAKAIEIDPALPQSFYAALGFFVAGGLALARGPAERLAATARRLARQGALAADERLAAIAGVDQGALVRLLDSARLSRGDRGRDRDLRRAAAAAPRADDRSDPPPARDGHPFAKLQELKLA